MQKKLNVVIVGRPNVGKSSIFNKFVRKRIGGNKAIVFCERGTTIDYKTDYSDIFECELTDTAGLSDDLTFSQLCNRQTELAIEGATVVLFVIDGSEGVTNEDVKYARYLRKVRDDVPVVLIVNKCDTKAFKSVDDSEMYKLGFGEGVFFSAEHNIGFGEVIYLASKEIEKARELMGEEEADDEKLINLSIVGRQNVGKSTLLNRMFGDERAIVSPIAGTTRDTISVDIPCGEYVIRVSDTAGVRRRDMNADKIEQMAIQSTMISIQFAHIAILVIDGTVGFERQDMIIGEHVIQEGRGLIICLNKFDQVKDKKGMLEGLEEIARKYLASAPILTISAMTGFGCGKIYSAVTKAYEQWIRRIVTSKLNKWLRAVIIDHEHKLSKNKRAIKIKFITQYDIRPPRFFISVNRPDDMDETYKRYIINQLRKDFGFEGTPIRVEFGTSQNPYYDKNAQAKIPQRREYTRKR